MEIRLVGCTFDTNGVSLLEDEGRRRSQSGGEGGGGYRTKPYHTIPYYSSRQNTQDKLPMKSVYSETAVGTSFVVKTFVFPQIIFYDFCL